MPLSPHNIGHTIEAILSSCPLRYSLDSPKAIPNMRPSESALSQILQADDDGHTSVVIRNINMIFLQICQHSVYPSKVTILQTDKTIPRKPSVARSQPQPTACLSISILSYDFNIITFEMSLGNVKSSCLLIEGNQSSPRCQYLSPDLVPCLPENTLYQVVTSLSVVLKWA